MTTIENKQLEHLSKQIEAQNIRIEAQNARIEQTNLHIQETNGKIDLMYNALLGSKITKDGGMVKRLQDTEIGLAVLKKMFANYKSAGIGIIWILTVLTGLIGLVVVIWKNVFKH